MFMFFNGCYKLSVQPLKRTHNKGCTPQTSGEKVLGYLCMLLFISQSGLCQFFHVLMLNLAWLIFLRHLGLLLFVLLATVSCRRACAFWSTGNAVAVLQRFSQS